MILFIKNNWKPFAINIFFLISFPWLIEISLKLIDYKGNKLDKERLEQVIERYNEINNNRDKNIKKFLNNNIYPTFYPGTAVKMKNFENFSKKLDFFPLGSQPNQKLYLCDEGYGFKTYRTDHLGFRNPEDSWDKYPYNTLIFGDSYVHGSCVSDENTISGNLIKLGVSNINLGIGDNQPLIYSSGIIQFSNPIPPKNIVLIFSLHNDLMGNDKRYNNYMISKKNYDYIFSKKENKHVLSSRGEKFFEFVDSEIQNKIKYNKKSDEISHQNNLQIKSFLKLNKFRLLLKDELNIHITKNIFCFKNHCIYGSLKNKIRKDIENAIYDSKILLKECNYENNCNPIIVLIAHSTHWDKDYLYNLRRKEFISEIKKLKRDHKYFKFLDSTNFLDPLNLENYAPAGGHLSNEGYRKVAIEIKRYLN